MCSSDLRSWQGARACLAKGCCMQQAKRRPGQEPRPRLARRRVRGRRSGSWRFQQEIRAAGRIKKQSKSKGCQNGFCTLSTRTYSYVFRSEIEACLYAGWLMVRALSGCGNDDGRFSRGAASGKARFAGAGGDGAIAKEQRLRVFGEGSAAKIGRAHV